MPVFTGGRWVTPGQVYPTVSWSFATFNYDYSSQLFGYRAFDGQVPDSHKDLVRQAFSAWESVSFIDFVESTDGRDVDIRLGNMYIDGAARPGQSTTLAAATTWTVNGTFLAAQVAYDIDVYNDRQTFYSVSVHEIGHAIGLGHSSSTSDVMYFSVSSANRAGNLSADDIAGIQQLYGARGDTSFLTAQLDPAGSIPATDLATAASALFFLGALPTTSEFTSRSAFATLQYNYYATALKVANPSVGMYEAFGAAFSSLPAFREKYAVINDTVGFVHKAYQDVFHRAATDAQIAHFNDQISYFRGLYTNVGMSSAEAEVKARGAASGQMLGFAMTDAAERQKSGQTLDDTVAKYFSSASTEMVGLVAVDDHAAHDHGYGFGCF